MNRREFVIGGTAIVGATTVGAIAFTTASVAREITIDIASDEQGIVGLSPGTTNAVELVDSVLTIDTSTAESEGLNPDGSFRYGDSSDPTGAYAFSLTNNDDDGRAFTLGLSNFTFGGSAELALPLYESDGSPLGEVTTGTDQTITLSVAESSYVHIDVNTDGLDENDDMSGTLTIDAQ